MQCQSSYDCQSNWAINIKDITTTTTDDNFFGWNVFILHFQYLHKVIIQTIKTGIRSHNKNNRKQTEF